MFSAAPVEAVYPDDPAVYHYTYSVDDDYTGAQIYADEARDEQLTHGMYEVRSDLKNYRVSPKKGYTLFGKRLREKDNILKKRFNVAVNK